MSEYTKNYEMFVRACRKAQREYYDNRKGPNAAEYLQRSKRTQEALDKLTNHVDPVYMDTKMTALVAAVRDMRSKQNKYYANSNSIKHYLYLNVAKAAEKRVDDIVNNQEVEKLQMRLML